MDKAVVQLFWDKKSFPRHEHFDKEGTKADAGVTALSKATRETQIIFIVRFLPILRLSGKQINEKMK
jgi:hypothetical protein